MSVKWQGQDFYIGRYLPMSVTFKGVRYEIPGKISYNATLDRYELTEEESIRFFKFLAEIPK